MWKWAPNGNAQERNFKLQGEYFWRREDGDLTYDTDGALGITQTGSYRSNQTGFYVQGVYQFMPRWRVGVALRLAHPGSVDYGMQRSLPDRRAYNPQRTAVMLDWTPTEFSRFRLQYRRRNRGRM